MEGCWQFQKYQIFVFQMLRCNIPKTPLYYCSTEQYKVWLHTLTQIVFLCTLNWTDFYTWGQVMIATSPLQRPGQYVLYEALFLFSLTLCHRYSAFMSLCLSLSPLFIASLRRPAHHSARTPQQPFAIREEPTAAVFINIDSDPSEAFSPFTLAERTRGAAAGLQHVECCYERYLISSCNKCLPGEWSQLNVKRLGIRNHGLFSFFF